MSDIFETVPRWKGAPPICVATNLLAFVDEKALKNFNEDETPGCKILATWHCRKCSHYHSWGIAPDPAGGSSGTGRTSKEGARVIPKRILDLIKETKV